MKLGKFIPKQFHTISTELMEPIFLRTSIIMDQEQLNSDILLALPNDPLYSFHLKDPKPH